MHQIAIFNEDIYYDPTTCILTWNKTTQYQVKRIHSIFYKAEDDLSEVSLVLSNDYVIYLSFIRGDHRRFLTWVLQTIY